jgi:hypothetical protein
MLVYGKIVVNYFRGAMLVVSCTNLVWVTCLVDPSRGSRTVGTRSYLGHTQRFLVEVILSFITIKSKIKSRVLTVLNDRMVPGV